MTGDKHTKREGDKWQADSSCLSHFYAHLIIYNVSA